MVSHSHVLYFLASGGEPCVRNGVIKIFYQRKCIDNSECGEKQKNKEKLKFPASFFIHVFLVTTVSCDCQTFHVLINRFLRLHGLL